MRRVAERIGFRDENERKMLKKKTEMKMGTLCC
jgi:hypothetical protein